MGRLQKKKIHTMARYYRKFAERSKKRMLWKSVSSWSLVVLLMVASILLVKLVATFLSDYQAEVFPLIQLERGYVSRRDALNQLRDFIEQVRAFKKSADFQNHTITTLKDSKWRFAKQISRDVSVIQGLGLVQLMNELDVLFSDGLLDGEDSFTGENNDSFTRHFVTHKLCYDEAFTPQGNHRQVDPSFCPRLINLFNDIQQGVQPPLLTVFTWLPDPMFDVERLRRRLLFQNWDMLRPLVQPVLVTDSRANMALANFYDWPCLAVPSYSSNGIPVFRNIASTVRKLFRSTFYGYVKPTTVFDASLVETLLKLKELYIDNRIKDTGSLTWDAPTNGQNAGFVRPVLLYGRALRAAHVGDMNHLKHVSEVVNTTASRVWEERKDSLVYFFFAGVDFNDIPDLIVDDKYLTSLLVSRSMALGHLVVDASATIYCVHIHRDKNTSEWDTAYLYTKPRDPLYNRRLGSQYFHSTGLRKPEKWFNEVGTKFARSGGIFIDIRSEKASGGQGEAARSVRS